MNKNMKLRKFDRLFIIEMILKRESNEHSRFALEHMSKNDLKAISFNGSRYN